MNQYGRIVHRGNPSSYFIDHGQMGRTCQSWWPAMTAFSQTRSLIGSSRRYVMFMFRTYPDTIRNNLHSL